MKVTERVVSKDKVVEISKDEMIKIFASATNEILEKDRDDGIDPMLGMVEMLLTAQLSSLVLKKIFGEKQED